MAIKKKNTPSSASDKQPIGPASTNTVVAQDTTSVPPVSKKVKKNQKGSSDKSDDVVTAQPTAVPSTEKVKLPSPPPAQPEEVPESSPARNKPNKKRKGAPLVQPEPSETSAATTPVATSDVTGEDKKDPSTPSPQQQKKQSKTDKNNNTNTDDNKPAKKVTSVRPSSQQTAQVNKKKPNMTIPTLQLPQIWPQSIPLPTKVLLTLPSINKQLQKQYNNMNKKGGADKDTTKDASTPADGKPVKVRVPMAPPQHRPLSHDPSLQYYENPMRAPIIQQAADYFGTLRSAHLAFDHKRSLDVSKHATIIDDVQYTPYDMDTHFKECQECQHATHVVHTGKDNKKNNIRKNDNTSSNGNEKKHYNGYPFHVIMDKKDQWRTHAKLAVCPCSDHNTHLSINKPVVPNYKQQAATTTASTTPATKDTEQSSSTMNDNTEEEPQPPQEGGDDEQYPQEDDKFGIKGTTDHSKGFHYHGIPRCFCGKAHIGLYQPGTHIIAPGIANTPGHHPLLNYAIEMISHAIHKSNITPYSDIDGTGFLRFVVLTVPNTHGNSLYAQYVHETQNGSDYSKWKSLHLVEQAKLKKQKKGPLPPPQDVVHPQLQLSLVWSEGISDQIKKDAGIRDVEPLHTLPFPLAFDYLKTSMDIFNQSNTSTDSTTIAATNGSIKYTQQRNESHQQLYRLIQTLLNEYKALPAQFIEWAQLKGYNIVTEEYWNEQYAPYFIHSKDVTNDKDTSATDKVDDSANTTTTTPAMDDTATTATPSATTPVTKQQKVKGTAKKEASNESTTTITDKDTSEDKVFRSHFSPYFFKCNHPKLSIPEYKLPICRICSHHHTNPAIYQGLASALYQYKYFSNPKWQSYPALDTLNTQSGLLWGSIYAHYNNSWSHGNAVYVSHPHAWQHIYGNHLIYEHIIDKIPLQGIDYSLTSQMNPSRTRGNAVGSSTQSNMTTERKNTVITFDNDNDDNNNNTNTTAITNTDIKYDTNTPLFGFPPSIFRQGNFTGFGHLLNHVIRLLPHSKHLYEFHAGTGTISLHTLHHTLLLTASDLNANNKITFDATVQRMLQSNYVHQYDNNITTTIPNDDDSDDKDEDTSSSTEEQQQDHIYRKVLPYLPLSSDLAIKHAPLSCDVILLDPPRKGLDEETLNALCLPYINIKHDPTINNTKHPFNLKPLYYEGNDTHSKALYKQVHQTVFQYNKLNHKLQSKITNYNSTLQDIPTTKPDRRSKYNDNKEKEDGQWLRTASTLIYISCGFPAFQKDSQRLLESGWKLAHAHGHLLFPGANHIETVAVFIRQ